MKREVSASYTVEASFVMAVTFFFIAALLNGVFEVHGRITPGFGPCWPDVTAPQV